MKKVFLTIVSLVFVAGIAIAQTPDTNVATHAVSITVPAVSLIDIEGGTTISLNPVAPIEAGLTFTAPAANSALWLNLTSIVPASQTRTVNVSMTGTLSEALSVTVQAASPTTSGNGTKGTPAGGALTLTGTDQAIITGIGSGYTGDGGASGFNLTYNLVIDNTQTANLLATTSNLTVTYTMTAVN
jgi:hypothetical protein